MEVWRDVRFDHAAASSAADALCDLAAALDVATEVRERMGVAARRDWRGRSRQEADAVLFRQRREAADLVDDLRRAADRILLAADAAVVEQARRERHREELLRDPRGGRRPQRVP
jgi:hypothetical protein